MLTITEEVLLFLHDQRQAGFVTLPQGSSIDVVLAGAVLADLAFAGRIDTALDSLMLVDPTPLGDALLDPTLAKIAAHATDSACTSSTCQSPWRCRLLWRESPCLPA